MSNPEKTSNNPIELEAQGTESVLTRSRNHLLISMRQGTSRNRTHTSNVAGVNRRCQLRVAINHRVLALDNESRKRVVSAIARALQIDESPTEAPNRPEGDRVSHHIELNESNVEGFNNESAPANTIPRQEDGADYNNDIVEDHMNFNDAEGLDDTVHDDMENESPPRGSNIFNIIRRTATSGRNILSNIFKRRQPSSDNSGRGL